MVARQTKARALRVGHALADRGTGTRPCAPAGPRQNLSASRTTRASFLMGRRSRHSSSAGAMSLRFGAWVGAPRSHGVAVAGRRGSRGRRLGQAIQGCAPAMPGHGRSSARVAARSGRRRPGRCGDPGRGPRPGLVTRRPSRPCPVPDLRESPERRDGKPPCGPRRAASGCAVGSVGPGLGGRRGRRAPVEADAPRPRSGLLERVQPANASMPVIEPSCSTP